MGVAYRSQFFCNFGIGVVPTDFLEFTAGRIAFEGMKNAIGIVGHLGSGLRLGANVASRLHVILGAANLGDATISHFHGEAAHGFADAAERLLLNDVAHRSSLSRSNTS